MFLENYIFLHYNRKYLAHLNLSYIKTQSLHLQYVPSALKSKQKCQMSQIWVIKVCQKWPVLFYYYLYSIIIWIHILNLKNLNAIFLHLYLFI